ncbi:MAG: DUF1439 domain-containing protein [Verrucomicrobiota bacterium]
MKRGYIVVAVVMFVVALVVIRNFPRKNHVMVISSEQMEQALEEVVPFSFSYALTLHLTFTNFTVSLNEENGRIDLAGGMKIEKRLSGEAPGEGAVAVTAVPVYDELSRQVELAEIDLVACTHPKEDEASLKNIPHAARLAVIKFLTGAAIYEVRPDDVQRQKDLFELKAWAIEKGRLKIRLLRAEPIRFRIENGGDEDVDSFQN